MEEFSLEKYFANPERKVVTGGGRPVRIVCTDIKGDKDYPILALVETDGNETIYSYAKDGRYKSYEVNKDLDLFFAPTKHEGWVNIYKSDYRITTSKVHSSETEAKKKIKTKTMEEFSLEKYLANPERKVVTRGGEPVRIICTDRKGSEKFPILALVETDGKEYGCSYTEDGRYVSNKVDDNLDLFFVPTEYEGWVNIFRSEGSTWVASDMYPTKIEAKAAGCTCEGYVATAKIEWEE